MGINVTPKESNMKKVKLIIGLFLGVLLISVAGCSNMKNALDTITSQKITQKDVYILQNGFVAAENVATHYIMLPACKAGQTLIKDQCSSDTVVQKIIPAVRIARKDVDDLQSFANAHPNEIGTSGIYSAAKSAYQNLQDILTAYNITPKTTGVVQ